MHGGVTGKAREGLPKACPKSRQANNGAGLTELERALTPQKWPIGAKNSIYNFARLTLANAAAGFRRGRFGSNQVQFPAIQQFPLHRLAWLQTNGCGQRQRKTDVQPGLLSA